MTTDHRRRRYPLPLVVAIVAVALAPLAAVAAKLAPHATHHAPTVAHRPAVTPSPTPSSPPPAARPLPKLFLNAGTWVSWASTDNASGDLATGGQAGSGITASVVKVGIAADYLAAAEQAHREPAAAELATITRMIRDSDNVAAEKLYETRGGRAVIDRLTVTCGLAHTFPGRTWGVTLTTAADLAVLGACLTGGHLAGPRWTGWLMDQMRSIRGAGAFGITTGRPTDRGQPVAYKNGWLVQDGLWHVNCLAVTPRWTLAVMSTYPASYGLGYGADLCAQLAVTAPADPGPPAPAAGPRAPDRI